MDTQVLLLVLFAALMHASWNAMVKSAGNKLMMTTLVAGASGLLAGLGLLFLPAMTAAAWPHALLSIVLQVFYFGLLAAAYHHADMSQTYPIMRGSAPMLVALVSRPLTGESLGATGWLAVLLICGGVFGLLGSWQVLRQQGKGARYALLNAVVIAIYTLNDGMGVRVSGHALVYTLSIFFIAAVPIVLWAWYTQREPLLLQMRQQGGRAVVGGVFTLGSYGVALWAMTRAPVAMISALRETSILFACLISAWILKEPMSRRRWLAVGLIGVGAATMRLA